MKWPRCSRPEPTIISTKPFSLTQLTARIKAALNLKTAQDRSDLLTHLLLTMNHELDQSLHARNSDLVEARNALVLALAELVAYRDVESGSHLMRLQHYSRFLAEQAAQCPGLAGQIDTNFIQLLACCAPLHDIGKVGLPDYILLKPGKLAPDERIIMQTHTTIGAAVLQKVARQHGFAATFLQMAIDIARHHHERYDGTGYPDRLAGSAIPLAARIVAVGDVYDALRSRRVYKPALSHQEAMSVMTQSCNGQFDPILFQIFQQNADSSKSSIRNWRIKQVPSAGRDLSLATRKFEIQSTKFETISKSKIRNLVEDIVPRFPAARRLMPWNYIVTACFEFSFLDFGFVSDFEFWISNLPPMQIYAVTTCYPLAWRPFRTGTSFDNNPISTIAEDLSCPNATANRRIAPADQPS